MSNGPRAGGAFRQNIPMEKSRILFIENEEDLAFLCEMMLQSLGYDVVVMNDSADALVAFDDEPEKFDLIITDLSMPKMNGAQLSMEILKIRPDIPIILCTGFGFNDSQRENCRKIGIKEFLEKPFFRSQMAEAIERSL